MDNNSFLSLLDSVKDCGNEQKTHSTNGKYGRPENLMRKTLELVVYDGKIRLHEYPVDGMCLVETPTKSIHKMCKVDPHELEVICDLNGYRGYLTVSYMREMPEQEKRKWGCNYSVSDYCHPSSIQNDTDMGDSFSIVLWAGTVGIGLRPDGTLKDLHRTENEVWAELFPDRRTDIAWGRTMTEKTADEETERRRCEAEHDLILRMVISLASAIVSLMFINFLGA